MFEESSDSRGGRNPVGGAESLSALRGDLSRFYRLNHKLRALNSAPGHERPDAMVNRLNRMLRTQGLGGSNSGESSKAYFLTDGKEVLLVANSVVDGREVSSRQALADAFAKIDRILADPFTSALSDYEGRIREISAEYADNTNDAFRLADGFLNLTGKVAKAVGKEGWEGADASYGRRIDSVRNEASATVRLFEKYYAERLGAIGKEKINSGKLSAPEREELALLETQKARFEKLKGAKLESPPWITVEVAKQILTKEGMADAGKQTYAAVKGIGYGVGKSVYESAKFFFYETPVFLYKYSADKEFSSQVDQAVSEARASIAKYAKEHGTAEIFTDFFKLLGQSISKEYESIKKLPPEEQAFRIGEIVGNVLLILAGPKLAKDALRSSAMRIKSSAEKIAALRAAGKVVEISKVRTWDDLESAVSHIKRIRGRGEAGDLRMAVQKLRMGAPDADLKSLPNAGGIRDAANLLMKNGGYLPDDQARKLANWVDQGVDLGKRAYRKTADLAVSVAPDADISRKMKELSLLGREFESLRGIHDAIDLKIVSVRKRMSEFFSMKTADSASFLLSDVRVQFAQLVSMVEASGVRNPKAAAIFAAFSSALEAAKPVVHAVSDTVDSVKDGTSFLKRKVGAQVDGIVSLSERVADKAKPVVDKAKAAADRVESSVAKFRDRLPASVRKTLSFDGGFATYKDPTSGKSRYVRPDGTFLKGSDGLPIQFEQGSTFSKTGAVVSFDGKKFGMLDRNGKLLIEAKFDTIRELSENRVVVGLDGKYEMLERGESGILRWKKVRYSEVEDLGRLESLSNPSEGRAFATALDSEGNRSVRMLRGDGARTQSFTTPNGKERYDVFDDFSEDGFVAVRSAKEGKGGTHRWHILDREGKRYGLRSEGDASTGFHAEDAADALNRFREQRKIGAYATLEGPLPENVLEKLLSEKFPMFNSKKFKFEPTSSPDVFRVSERGRDGRKGLLNARTGKHVPAEYEAINYSDVPEGYARVKKDGYWGLVDVETGEVDIVPEKHKFVSLSVSNERIGIFEAEVEIFPGNPDLDIPAVRKTGLVSANGKILIEPKYDRIVHPREGLYQGVSVDPEHPGKIVGRPARFDSAHAESFKSAGGGANFHTDGFGSVTKSAMSLNNARIRVGSAERSIDPFRRVFKEITPQRFFSSDPDLFGPGKPSFEQVLRKSFPIVPPTKTALLAEFERFAAARSHDFVEHYANVQGRPLSAVDSVRIRYLFSGEMRDYVENRLNLLRSTFSTNRIPALESALRSYIATLPPAPDTLSMERLGLPFAEPFSAPNSAPTFLDPVPRRGLLSPL